MPFVHLPPILLLFILFYFQCPNNGQFPMANIMTHLNISSHLTPNGHLVPISMPMATQAERVTWKLRRNNSEKLCSVILSFINTSDNTTGAEYQISKNSKNVNPEGVNFSGHWPLRAQAERATVPSFNCRKATQPERCYLEKL